MRSAQLFGCHVLVELLDAIASDRDVDDVAFLDDEVGPPELRNPETRQRNDVRLAVDVELAHAMTSPLRRDETLDEAHLGARVDPLDRRRLREDAAQHALDRPLDG